MPQPPRDNETKNEFISRCVKYLNDNHEYKDNTQRVAVCYNYWNEHQKKKKKESKSFIQRMLSIWKKNQE